MVIHFSCNAAMPRRQLNAKGIERLESKVASLEARGSQLAGLADERAGTIGLTVPTEAVPTSASSYCMNPCDARKW